MNRLIVRTVAALALAVSVGAAPTPAAATEFVDNSSVTSGGVLQLLPGMRYATFFEMPDDGTLSAVALHLSASPSAPATATVYILDGNGGEPGDTIQKVVIEVSSDGWYYINDWPPTDLTGAFGYFLQVAVFGDSALGWHVNSDGVGALNYQCDPAQPCMLAGSTAPQYVLADTPITINDPGAVPEPATWAMMVIGFAAVGSSMRRRRRNAVRFAAS